jgi:proteasome lid subunit RPN8/RPN11
MEIPVLTVPVLNVRSNTGAAAMNDVTLVSWSVAESPIAIEYSLAVIEEIRYEVSQGFQPFSRSVTEVGGVLYGTRDGGVTRVTSMRAISCEHAHGPAFRLSETDYAELNRQLAEDAKDPRIEGLIVVGWFLSHSRNEIMLAESDLEVYSIFFPAPWQITMVVRPGRGGSMRAGFFVRELDGTVKSEHSYQEFNFPDRLAGVPDRAPQRPARASASEPRLPRFPPVQSPFVPGIKLDPIPSGPPRAIRDSHLSAAPVAAPRTKWIWLVPWAVTVLAVGYLAVRTWMPRTSTAEPISLAVSERDGRLQIEWNHNAGPVEADSGGSLAIIDGGYPQIVPLSQEVLASGKYTYVPKTGDIEVRMTVNDASGGKVQETSLLVGPSSASAPSPDLTPLQTHPNVSEDELRRLREENSSQAARIQQLERSLRIFQMRLGIDQGKEP